MNWTEGRLRGFIVNTLRSGMRRYPPKYETLNDAKVGKRVNPKTKRSAEYYKCSGCGGEFVKKDIEVDHRIPVIDPQKGFQGWDEYITRLFCDKSNLQALCRSCHKQKTRNERGQRRVEN